MPIFHKTDRVVSEKYRPIIIKDLEDSVPVSSTKLIYEYEGVGKLDFLSFWLGSTTKLRMVLTIDGEEVYNLNIRNLKNSGCYLSGSFAIGDETEEIFQNKYYTPVDFKKGFKLEIKNTDPTIVYDYEGIIKFRKRIF